MAATIGGALKKDRNLQWKKNIKTNLRMLLVGCSRAFRQIKVVYVNAIIGFFDKVVVNVYLLQGHFTVDYTRSG
jgi:hypothetical protein